MLTGILPVRLKILWEHNETKSFYIKKNQTNINGSNENFPKEIHIHRNEMLFICSSSADLYKFQNSVYRWQESPGIAVGDFQKSPPPLFLLKKLRQG